MADKQHDTKELMEFPGFIKRLEDGESFGGDAMEKWYDHWNQIYDKEHALMEYCGPAVVSTKMAQVCPDGSLPVLDCACGTGLIGEAMKSLGFTDITGVDFSQTSVDIASKKGCYKEVIRAECGEKSLPFEDNSFDSVVAISCLGHCHVQPVAIRDWVRVVKPGGVIVFTVRPFYFRDEHEYGKRFNAQIEDLVESGQLRQESKDHISEWWKGTDAYLFVFRVHGRC